MNPNPKSGGRRDVHYFPQVYVIGTHSRPVPTARPTVPAFPSPCVLLAAFRVAFPKPHPPSHLPPANYSFKVVFRDVRDFHSVPLNRELCSNGNILYVHNVPIGT